MSLDVNQIDISATSRGITDHFFCFTCDEYVWDCDHLIDERLARPKARALEPSGLRSFGYDGTVRQTVRTVCRLPRIYRFSEARNVRRHSFDDYLLALSPKNGRRSCSL